MHPLLRSPHWREVKIETIACPYGSTRSVAYVRLPGNSVAVAIDCDAACLSPECPLAGPEEGDGGDGDPSGCHASSSVSPVRSGDGDASVTTGAACACREVCVRGDPTGWLVDPAFSTIYDPERHGVAFRIDWPRLVALLLGERAEGRLLTLCMGRAGLTVVVREHATMQKEVCVRLAPAWTVSLSLALCPRVRERFSGVAFFSGGVRDERGPRRGTVAPVRAAGGSPRDVGGTATRGPRPRVDARSGGGPPDVPRARAHVAAIRRRAVPMSALRGRRGPGRTESADRGLGKNCDEPRSLGGRSSTCMKNVNSFHEVY